MSNTKDSKFQKFKDSFMGWLNEKAIPAFAKFSAQRHMLAIRNGIVSTIPFIIFGAFALLLLNFPLSDDGSLLLKNIMPIALNNMLFYVYSYSMSLMGLYAAFGIGSELGKSYGFSQTTSGLLGAFGFLIWVMPATLGNSWTVAIPIGSLAGTSMFAAIIASVASIEIYHFCRRFNLTIRMPDSVPKAISDSFAIIVPVAIVGLLFGTLRYIVGFDLIDFMSLLLAPLQDIFTDNFGGVVIIVLFVTLFWWFGIHGTAMIEAFARPIWQSSIATNSALYVESAGTADYSQYLHYPEQFLQWFVWIGGAGATLGLVIATLMVAKSKQSKAIAGVCIVPGVFNINEPTIFGFPVMLNPLLFLPFVFIPLIMSGVAAALQPLFGVNMVLQMAWTLPFFLGSYFSSGGDAWAIVISFITFGISVGLWWPFAILYDRNNLKNEGLTISQAKIILAKDKADKREKKLREIEEAKNFSKSSINIKLNILKENYAFQKYDSSLRKLNIIKLKSIRNYN